MNKRILVGVDMEYSPLTQQALRVTSEFFVLSSFDLSIVLLTVIPTIDTLPSRNGKYGGPFSYLGSTRQQRLQANQALRKAYLVLTQGGMVSDQIKLLRREGRPAEEMAKVAQELSIDCIVMGSHKHSFLQEIRRVFVGSTSHQVLQHAPCPLMMVVLPRAEQPRDLVTWYEEAVIHYLDAQAGRLSILTSDKVA